MTNKNVKLRKLLNVTLLGAICVAPLGGGIAAKADQPNHDQSTQDSSKQRTNNQGNKSSQSRPNNQNNKPNQSRPNNQSNSLNQPRPNNQSRTPNQSQTNNQNQSRPNNQSHTQYQSRPNNQGHNQNQARPNNQSQHQNGHGTNNHTRDANWYTGHGYVKNGSSWLWHGHNDAWWINNNYGWNGSIWILLNISNNSYGPFERFRGAVTQVNYGNNEFDIQIGGNIYNVYPNRSLDPNMYQGDMVRVYGQRYGSNDIRNANFRIMQNN